MNEGTAKNMSREERLAAKLRENLRRRKVQARAQTGAVPESLTEPLTGAPIESLPNPPSGS